MLVALGGGRGGLLCVVTSILADRNPLQRKDLRIPYQSVA